MTREAVQTVRDALPDVRLVLMIRDPVSRHWAHTKRYFSKARIAEREGDVLSVPGWRATSPVRRRGAG